MFLFVGLGNPGKEYEKNRHNLGFMAVDTIAEDHSFSSYKAKFRGCFSEGNINGEKVFIIKPSTYMNKSGGSVAEIVKFYKIPLENIAVFYDELDLPLGKVRVKIGGGSGGHNGIKDLDRCLGKNYKRIRCGIDHPGDRDRVSAYVLSNFAKSEEDSVCKLISDVSTYCTEIIKGNDSLFMTKLSS